MTSDGYRVMGVCVWEADVKICHALHLRTMEAAAARLTCHVPYTAVSNSHPKTHQSPLPLTEHSVLRSEAWMTILNLLMFFLSLLLIWKCTRRENDVCQTQNHHCLNEHHGLTCQNSFFGLIWFDLFIIIIGKHLGKDTHVTSFRDFFWKWA